MKLLIIVAILLSVSSATNNPECVCIKPHRSPEEVKSDRRQSFDKAAAVFLGKVVSLNAYVVRFRLGKRWKGNPEEEVVLSRNPAGTFPDGSPISGECDYAFRLGEEYLVYAYLEDQKLKNDDCATLKAKDAADEEKGLDEIKPHEVVRGIQLE
jgi:hypothetical protein